MDKKLLLKFINFTKEEYLKKSKTLDREVDRDMYYMLRGAILYMEDLSKDIECGKFN